jgi:DNA-binding MarR family transcriptional regulator
MTSELSDPIAEARRQWIKHWGAGPTSSMHAVTSIMRSQQILLTRLNALLSPYGLTFPRYEALMILYLSRRGSMPLGSLGRRLQVHPTSVTSLIDGLERRGFVVREPHESDRRATLATITPAGSESAVDATATLNEARFATSPLRTAQLDQVSKILRELRAQEDGF